MARPGSQRSVLAHSERKPKPCTGLTPPATEAASSIQQSYIATEAHRWKRYPLQYVKTYRQTGPGPWTQYTGPRADGYTLAVEAILYWSGKTSTCVLRRRRTGRFWSDTERPTRLRVQACTPNDDEVEKACTNEGPRRVDWTCGYRIGRYVLDTHLREYMVPLRPCRWQRQSELAELASAGMHLPFTLSGR